MLEKSDQTSKFGRKMYVAKHHDEIYTENEMYTYNKNYGVDKFIIQTIFIPWHYIPDLRDFEDEVEEIRDKSTTVAEIMYEWMDFLKTYDLAYAQVQVNSLNCDTSCQMIWCNEKIEGMI
jgi:hypothetical protein